GIHRFPRRDVISGISASWGAVEVAVVGEGFSVELTVYSFIRTTHSVADHSRAQQQCPELSKVMASFVKLLTELSQPVDTRIQLHAATSCVTACKFVRCGSLLSARPQTEMRLDSQLGCFYIEGESWNAKGAT